MSTNTLVDPIHGWMPVILDRENWSTWLTTESVTLSQLTSLIKPFDAERMQAWCVSNDVNRATKNSPALLNVMLL